MATLLTGTVAAQIASKFEIADQQTLRLKPSDFEQIPKPIVGYLEQKGCTIPQSFIIKTPHNVLEGEFFKRGQKDWAVLCSRNKISAILVFRQSSINSVTELAKSDDKNFLQDIDGNGNISFSRVLSVITPTLVENKNNGNLPLVDHDGINDAFAEKASDILYFYGRRWIRLQGAD